MEERREGRLRVLGFSDMDTKVIKDRHWVFVSLRHGPHPTTYREWRSHRVTLRRLLSVLSFPSTIKTLIILFSTLLFEWRPGLSFFSLLHRSLSFRRDPRNVSSRSFYKLLHTYNSSPSFVFLLSGVVTNWLRQTNKHILFGFTFRTVLRVENSLGNDWDYQRRIWKSIIGMSNYGYVTICLVRILTEGVWRPTVTQFTKTKVVKWKWLKDICFSRLRQKESIYFDDFRGFRSRPVGRPHKTRRVHHNRSIESRTVETSGQCYR